MGDTAHIVSGFLITLGIVGLVLLIIDTLVSADKVRKATPKRRKEPRPIAPALVVAFFSYMIFMVLSNARMQALCEAESPVMLDRARSASEMRQYDAPQCFERLAGVERHGESIEESAAAEAVCLTQWVEKHNGRMPCRSKPLWSYWEWAWIGFNWQWVELSHGG